MTTNAISPRSTARRHAAYIQGLPTMAAADETSDVRERRKVGRCQPRATLGRVGERPPGRGPAARREPQGWRQRPPCSAHQGQPSPPPLRHEGIATTTGTTTVATCANARKKLAALPRYALATWPTSARTPVVLVPVDTVKHQDEQRHADSSVDDIARMAKVAVARWDQRSNPTGNGAPSVTPGAATTCTRSRYPPGHGAHPPRTAESAAALDPFDQRPPGWKSRAVSASNMSDALASPANGKWYVMQPPSNVGPRALQIWRELLRPFVAPRADRCR